ncbi:MAG: M23 family metallopeptidase, partial [Magnetococcales bacterium]|nr:M23 family metallopeptidase [Magnetococcales bacterium]
RGVSRHSVALRAPFLGRWHVYQGFQGAHTHQGPWRHALDFHRLVHGQAYRGDGAALEDFYCFGEVVRSPAWGQVVAQRSDLPDLPPGEVDPVNCWGNYVLLAIGGDDHVLIGHLRQNSITVAWYEHVVPGQVIGQCGNSGRSPQPHIHLHVQTGHDLGSPTRPFHLSGVCIGRQFLLDSTPTEGDQVTVPHVGAALKRSLHIQIGRRLVYVVGQREMVLEVDLDPTNHFGFVAESGARVLLVETDNLLALYERFGTPDTAFDAFVLALGLTPLIEVEAEWRDAPPTALLPLPRRLQAWAWLLPGLVVAESRYQRGWDGTSKAWRQVGEHALIFSRRTLWRCRSEAFIREGVGVVGFSLHGEGVGVDARLLRVGFKSDNGVEGWDEAI